MKKSFAPVVSSEFHKLKGGFSLDLNTILRLCIACFIKKKEFLRRVMEKSIGHQRGSFPGRTSSLVIILKKRY